MMKKMSIKKCFTTIFIMHCQLVLPYWGLFPWYLVDCQYEIDYVTIFQLKKLVLFWYPLISFVSKFFRRPWSRNPTNLHPHSWKWWNRSYLHSPCLSQSWSGLVQRWASFWGETRNFRPSGQQAFHYSDWYQRANLRCLQMQSH